MFSFLFNPNNFVVSLLVVLIVLTLVAFAIPGGQSSPVTLLTGPEEPAGIAELPGELCYPGSNRAGVNRVTPVTLLTGGLCPPGYGNQSGRLSHAQLIPRSSANSVAYSSLTKSYCLFVTMIPLLGSLYLWATFDAVGHNLQMVVTLERLHLNFGVDSVSLSLTLLTAGLFPICIMLMRTFRGYITFLLLEIVIYGTLNILDLLGFYILFEASLILLFLLIGRTPFGNIEAAYKIFLYTMAGSLVLLPIIFVLYALGGSTSLLYLMSNFSFESGSSHTPSGHSPSFLGDIKISPKETKFLEGGFAIPINGNQGLCHHPEGNSGIGIYQNSLGDSTLGKSFKSFPVTLLTGPEEPAGIAELPGELCYPGSYRAGDVLTLLPERQLILGWGLFLVFAVKIPLMPVHLWLPEAHVAAPTAGSVLLAGVLLKLGGIGFIRFMIPILPTFTSSIFPLVCCMCLASFLFSTLSTIRQIDLKKIVAYSSIGHMAMITLAIFSMSEYSAYNATFMMVAHGLVSPCLFLLVGLLYDRYHTKFLLYFTGLGAHMPIFSIFFFICTLANLSFPLFPNFVAEYLCLTSIFSVHSLYAYIFCICQVLGTVASFWAFNRIVHGYPTVITLNHTIIGTQETSFLERDYVHSNGKTKWAGPISRLENALVLPLIFSIVWLGVKPMA